MSFPLIKKTTTGSKLLIFLLLIVFGMVFGSVLGMLVTGMTGSSLSEAGTMQLMQAINQITGFIIPPLAYVALVKEEPLNALGFKKLPAWSLLGTVAMFTVIPFNNALAEWNESMNLPETLRMFEDMAQQASEQMLNEGNFFVNILIFGALAAFGEELLFRSVIQKALIKIFKNPHIGIVVTAILFSAVHIEFFGFYPRLMLGLMLGYIFWMSSSIWVSMLMHFVNNSTVVVLYFLNNKGIINIDADHFGSTDNILVIALSLMVTVAIFWACYRFKGKKSIVN